MASAAGVEPQHRAPKTIKRDPHVCHAHAPRRLDLSIQDFEMLRVLGEGSLSTVFLALWKAKGSQHALKVIDKAYIARHNMTEAVIRERNVMDRLVSDCVVELQFTFQDAQKLYMGMEVCPNGDLYDQISARQGLPVEDARVYAAEMVTMLAVLREHSVVFRDFKPENMLLDAEGHLKLTDFGCAKVMDSLHDVPDATPPQPDADAPAEEGSGDEGRASEDAAAAPDAPVQFCGLPSGRQPKIKRKVSFVGTADYLAPETLENTSCSCAVDLWALGCVVYQMLMGKTPFRGKSEYLTMMNISERSFAIPESFDADMADLVTRLLRPHPAERLGFRDIAELKAHAAFKGIDWDSLRQGQAPAYVPSDSKGDGEADLWEMQALQRTLPQ